MYPSCRRLQSRLAQIEFVLMCFVFLSCLLMLFGELIHNTFRSETERSRFSDVVNVYMEVDALSRNADREQNKKCHQVPVAKLCQFFS
jgi:hypothetical protein